MAEPDEGNSRYWYRMAARPFALSAEISAFEESWPASA
jgi:hypothetical protein